MITKVSPYIILSGLLIGNFVYAAPTGKTGLTGFTGSTGKKGSKGFIGNTGSTGKMGSSGFTGSTGFIGDTGSIGQTGSTGYTNTSSINTVSSVDSSLQKFESLLKSKQFQAAYTLLKNKNIEAFLPTMLDNFSHLRNSLYGLDILYLFLNRTSTRIALAQKVAQEIKQLPASALYMFSSYPDARKIIENALVALVNNGDAYDLFKGLQYCHTYNKQLPFLLTPTGLHLKQNKSLLHHQLISRYSANPELMNLVSQVIKKERELAQNYYTFVHGQRRAYYFTEKMYTFLWQLKNNQNLNNFIFAHVKPLLNEMQEKEEDSIRQYLLTHGRKPKDTITRQKLLFLNYAFFAQMNDSGSNTAYFVANNLNWGSSPIHITIQDAFIFLGYEDIYNNYSAEIKELAMEYEEGNFGNILLVAIPKNSIKSFVYLCQPGQGNSGMGGVKRSIWIDGIGTTDNSMLIMDHLIKTPSSITNTDMLEFCLIMTSKNGGLDPQTGIQIYPILSGDTQKLAALQAKEEQLCKRIQMDIKLKYITNETNINLK